ncbi:MAG: hypothetical protein IKJ16_02165 [Agathobacter sp.]|nr:hypothetical protein [Agathobacter sp.]
MKKVSFSILVFVLVLLSACGQNSQTDSGAMNESSPTVLYNKFLTGEISAEYESGHEISINDCLSESTYNMYAIHDMNGDTTPELLVKTAKTFNIFWIKNNQLCVWYIGSCYCKPLNNMAILSERPGGAPEHINYIYEILGYNGETMMRIDFSEYSSFEYEGEQYPELYMINDVKVDKDVYTSLTAPLLNIKDDYIKWEPIPT